MSEIKTWQERRDDDPGFYDEIYMAEEISDLRAALQASEARVTKLKSALEELMEWQVKNVHVWHNPAYDNAARVLEE